MGGYHPLSVSGPGLTLLSSSGGYPTNRPLDVVLLAVDKGGVTLRSRNDYDCLHVSPACLPPQKDWIAHVLVTE